MRQLFTAMSSSPPRAKTPAIPRRRRTAVHATSRVLSGVTSKDVSGLARLATMGIETSPAPARALSFYRSELKDLVPLADDGGLRAINRFLRVEGILALFQREARLGKATASALRREFLKRSAGPLHRLGKPYAAVVSDSIRWGDENGGTLHVGFDVKRLGGRFNARALKTALEQLPDRLAKAGADLQRVALFRQRYAAFAVR